MFSLESLRVDSFEWKTSLSLATASNLSYASAAAVKNTAINDWRFASTDFFDVRDTQGFIAIAPGIVLISFRGTESVADWIGNLKLASAPYDEFGHVHFGFLECYGNVRASIVAAAKAAAADGARVWITGHSLGGALATLAAADICKTCNIAGVHTFGQPRLASGTFQSFIAQNLTDRFHRFVNDDDIVPRVPPGYKHVGALIHFNGDGGLESGDDAGEAEDIEPPPLTEAEFRELQAEIKSVETSVAESDAVSREAVDATVEGLIPSFVDHRIERYIAAIRRHALGATQDSQLEADDVEAVFDSVTTWKGVNDAPGKRVPILLRLASDRWTPPDQIVLNSMVGSIASVQVFDDELAMLKADPQVLTIEPSRVGDTDEADFAPLMEDVEAEPDIDKGNRVNRGSAQERGDRALIGIIDSGVDVLHECFRDAAGGSRILAYWDQAESDGNSPADVASKYFTSRYGRLYLKAEIDAFIASGEAPSSLRDPGVHGTHVASIAGGRATGALVDGIAPDARFIVVSPHMSTGKGDPVSLGYSNSHVDALAFLKAAAAGDLGAAGDKNPVVDRATPIAVNVSLGMNAGAHDGSSTLEAAFDSMSGMGRSPGFVIVKSAGNERSHRVHARVRAFPGIETIEWESRPPPPGLTPRTRDYFEAWYSKFDDIEFTLVDPAGNRATRVSGTNRQVLATLGGNVCELRLTKEHPDNGDNRLTITISATEAPIQLGSWKLLVHGKTILSGSGEVDIWVERNGKRGVRFVTPDPRMTLSVPGTAITVITVGACHSADELQMIDASSYGRTRDNRAKPDLCAPGHKIIGAAAGGDTKTAIAMSGTSMAAPHVTGAIALVMSQRAKAGLDGLNARQFQSLLVKAVAAGPGYHHEGFGHGRLDIDKLLTIALA